MCATPRAGGTEAPESPRVGFLSELASLRAPPWRGATFKWHFFVLFLGLSLFSFSKASPSGEIPLAFHNKLLTWQLRSNTLIIFIVRPTYTFSSSTDEGATASVGREESCRRRYSPWHKLTPIYCCSWLCHKLPRWLGAESTAGHTIHRCWPPNSPHAPYMPYRARGSCGEAS